MLRNFKSIQNVPCLRTRIALATCEDSETLKRLEKAFPECFDAQEVEYFIGLWSEIRDEWVNMWNIPDNEWSDFDEKCFICRWDAALYDRNEPFLYEADVWFGKSKDDIRPIPPEIMQQLKEVTTLSRPIVIKYDDKEWIVSFYSDENEPHDIEHVHDFDLLNEDVESYWISLYPPHLIIFDKISTSPPWASPDS